MWLSIDHEAKKTGYIVESVYVLFKNCKIYF